MQPLVLGSVVVNLVVFVLGVLLLVVGYKSYRFGRIIRDTPTATPGSAAAGRAEVEGIAQPIDEPIESPFTGEAAVCLDWTIEERVPARGDDYKWVERAAKTHLEPFYLEDPRGGSRDRVLVRADEHPNPEELPWEYDSRRFTQSEAHEVEDFLQAISDDDNPGQTTNPAVTENPAQTEQPGTGHDDEVQYRYVMRLITPGTKLYVFGSLEPQYGYSDIGFVTDEDTGSFVINKTNESWVSAEAYWIGLLALAAGLLFVLWGGSIALGPLTDLLGL
jgi:hypothetical protein